MTDPMHAQQELAANMRPAPREVRMPRILPTTSEDPKSVVVVFDAGGNVRAVSRNLESLYGRRASDPQPDGRLAVYTRPDSSETGWFSMAMRGQIVADQHIRYAGQDGQPLELSVSAAPMLDGDADITGVIAVFADVGAAKRAEEAQQLLIEAGQVLASSLDTESTISEAARLFIPRLADWCLIVVREENDCMRLAAVAHSDPELAKAGARLFERYRPTFDEIRGIGAVIRTGEPSFMPNASDELRTAIAADPEHAEQLRALGTLGWMLLPLRARGYTLGAICFASRQLKRAYDAADLALAEELSRRVATAIDNARLYGKAKAAIEARDGVLSIVAHDLRNPVGTVQMTVDLLLEGALPEETRHRNYGIIRRATSRMKHLIQDLLDVASIEAGRLSIQQAEVEIAPLLAEVQETFAAQVDAKLQRLEVDIPAELPTMFVDRDRMLQVFTNLVGNAVKFTPEGGRIAVSATFNGDVMCFSVADSGVGIAADELARVFDRFWQSRRARRGGAGLGLAITKGIVEAHGGIIEVMSVPGEGATFAIKLPLEQRAARL